MSTDLLSQLAAFTFNHATRRYEVVVCGYIVAEFRTVREVESFSAMHHAGFLP